MKSIFLSILLCLFNSCTKNPDYCDLANHSMLSFSKEQRKKNGLFLEGFGGSMMHDIEKFNLSYTCLKTTLNETQALTFFLEIATEFLQKINYDPNIRPYLHNYPVTIENLVLSIAFVENHYQYTRPMENYVALIANREDTIRSWHYDHQIRKFCNQSTQSYSAIMNIPPTTKSESLPYCQSESSINTEIADGN